ncbi:hypothetical protein MUP59_09890, partial [Candidatus Bathyarchaeota archaeon]|nr:hypothetical protein [Candidatus Bathyarchaeota archaeon]
DSGSSRKTIESSIKHLAELGARLGVEFIMIGGNKNAVKSFDARFEHAVDRGRNSNSRIIVIHDVIFSALYHWTTNRHPDSLYEAYLQIGQEDKELGQLLGVKWKDLLSRTSVTSEFAKGLTEKLIGGLVSENLCS